MTAAEVIALLLQLAPEVYADVEAWVRAPDDEAKQVALARAAANSAVDAYQAGVDAVNKP